MSTESNRDPSVRTYRGRSLEELIPKIRAELGDDAIILRQREGLTGGLNGFFAQRCVEVDAQAAPPPAPAVDIYDEAEPARPEQPAAPAQAPDAQAQAPAAAAHEYQPAAAQAAEFQPPASAPAPEPPPAPAAAPTAPATPIPDQAPADELTFAQRLDAARREREAAVAQAPAPPAQPAPAAEAAAAAPEPMPPAPEAPRAAPAPEARRAAPAPAPAPAAAALDPAAAGVLARELIGHGISEAWAHELIVSAAAHLSPFAPGGELRDAVRAGLAAGISAAPLLPSSGAAVAFIGAGGAGKTRSSAALAMAYARASTLRVSVVSLTGGAHGNDIAALLEGRNVPVHVAHGDAAAELIACGREQGLVVVDTIATSPVDAAGVSALSSQLEGFDLDAVYLAVPATLSASAARGLLDGLAPVGPTAIVITHADETDELGIVTELAYLSGLPIAFIHSGLEPDSALAIADPIRVAAEVLP